MCILITAFPMRVAPKKVQNGTRKWPHVMPARSNRGLGMLEEETEINIGSRRERSHLAAARMPKKPTRSTNCWMPYLARSNLYNVSSRRWICLKGHKHFDGHCTVKIFWHNRINWLSGFLVLPSFSVTPDPSLLPVRSLLCTVAFH